MKVEPLIVSYLELNKKVAIESIGHFVFDGRTKTESSESEYEYPFEEGSVTFYCDKNEKSDSDLIDFIIQESGKIRPLATSDLESFSMLGKQFLNIGKPMIIRGLGYLINNQDGTYSFLQGEYIPEKTEVALPQSKSRSKESSTENNKSSIDFSSSKKKSESSKKWLPVAIITLLSMTGAVVYYFIQKEEEPLVEVVEPTPAIDNSQIQKPVVATDTSVKNINVDTTTVPALKDRVQISTPNEYYVIVRTYTDLPSAQRGFSRLNVLPFARQIKLITSDSVRYRIALPVKGALTDSTHIRDSVRMLFGKSAYVETIKR
jgi:hypothetical protein